MCDRFLKFPFGEARTPVEIVRLVEHRIQPKRRLKFLASAIVLTTQRQSERARGMGLGAFWIKLQCLPARCICRFEIGFAPVPIHIKKRAAVGNAGMRTREVRVDFNRAIKHAPRILYARAPHLMESLATAEV